MITTKILRETGAADGSFGVAEVVDPQTLRQFGNQLAAGWAKAVAPVTVPREVFDRVVEWLDHNGGGEAASELTALLK